MRALSATIRRFMRRWQYNEQYPAVGDRVFVAVSGGVDSGVAAALAKQQGFQVEGLFIRSWDAEGCSSSADLSSARDVCQSLNIDLHVIDLSKEYWLQVFEPLLAEYSRGRTPNPDKEKMNMSKEKWWLATGHYAYVSRLGSSSVLLRPADTNKDQTFFLCRVPQHALRRVRSLAKQFKLPNADRKDSQGLCFVSPGHRRFANFLDEYIPNTPGDIITTAGKKVGTHSGIWHGTIGEKSHCYVTNERWFIVAKDPVNNTITVEKGWDNPILWKSKIFASHWKFVDEIRRLPGTRLACLHAQIRHREFAGSASILILEDDKAIVELVYRIRAVAAGQIVVVWDGDMCVASGIIESAE